MYEYDACAYTLACANRANIDPPATPAFGQIVVLEKCMKSGIFAMLLAAWSISWFSDR